VVTALIVMGMPDPVMEATVEEKHESRREPSARLIDESLTPSFQGQACSDSQDPSVS